MDNTQKITLFENTPIPNAVAKLAVPTVLSSLVMVLYNMADTYFVGMLNDPIQNTKGVSSAIRPMRSNMNTSRISNLPCLARSLMICSLSRFSALTLWPDTPSSCSSWTIAEHGQVGGPQHLVIGALREKEDCAVRLDRPFHRLPQLRERQGYIPKVPGSAVGRIG